MLASHPPVQKRMENAGMSRVDQGKDPGTSRFLCGCRARSVRQDPPQDSDECYRSLSTWGHIEGRPLQADVAVVAEPIKARIITKGEAPAYFAAMPLQKDSWRHLVAKEVILFNRRTTPWRTSDQYRSGHSDSSWSLRRRRCHLWPVGQWRLFGRNGRAQPRDLSAGYGRVPEIPRDSMTFGKSQQKCLVPIESNTEKMARVCPRRNVTNFRKVTLYAQWAVDGVASIVPNPVRD